MKASPINARRKWRTTRPAHIWVDHAPYDLRCEGLDPLEFTLAKRFSPHHVEIVRGDRFLKKFWRTESGDEFASRHCVACGRELEATDVKA